MNWMKKSLLLIAVFAVGVVSGSMIWTSSANNTGLVNPNQPGSVNDPLITKSYVDQVVAGQVKTELEKQLQGQLEQLDKLLADKQKEMDDKIAQFQKQLDALISKAGGMTVVELEPNQTMYADPGATFIVRNGTTIAVSTDANGIPDVTGGKDLMDGTPIELNHMLIFPREGRGIKSTHSSTVFVMVTGGYTVMNPDGTIAASSSMDNSDQNETAE